MTLRAHSHSEPTLRAHSGTSAAPFYRLPQFVARDNLIRNIDNRSDPNRNTQNYAGLAMGIWLDGGTELAQNALYQRNVVRLDRDELPGNVGSLPYYLSSVKTFDNDSAAGNVILSRNSQIAGETAPELVITVQRAIDEVLGAYFLK